MNISLPSSVVAKALKRRGFHILALSLLTLASSPAYAALALTPLQNIANNIQTFVTGPFGVTIAILAIIALGIAAWMERLSWGSVGRAVAGIVLIFGAATMAPALIGAL
jgi:type IV secretion system protein VirB2